MNIYDRIIQNPLFFEWISHPSPEIKAYWKYYLEKIPEHVEFENATLPAQVLEPMLILGNREQIVLNQGESRLEYSEDGKILLNREQTLKGDWNLVGNC